MSDTTGKLISELKVHELRTELIGRGLDGNGVKATLVSRLEKALSEQGVDINTYLFVPQVNQAVISPEKKDATKSAAAAAAATKNTTKSDNADNDKEAKDVEQDEVVAEDLVEKVDDEQAGANETSAMEVDDNEYPDIGDLEERQESEEDDASARGDVKAIEVDESPADETNEADVDVIPPKPVPSNTSAIHVISDEEDVDYEEGDLDPQEKKLSESEANVTNDTDTTAPNAEEKGDGGPESQAANDSTTSTTNKAPSSTKSSGPKVPSGLKFPADDPQGLRCLWIRGIPAVARTSELKLAFMDAGFRGEVKIFCPKQTATSKQTAFGFVTLETEQMAADAVRKMHNSIFKGNTISVERACDSSMLQSDLVGTATNQSRSHPPIKPPEKPGKKSAPGANKPPRNRARRGGALVTAPERNSKGSHYLDKVRTTRILRPSASRRGGGGGGRGMPASNRSFSPRRSGPSYSGRGGRSTRPPRTTSPLYVSRQRKQSPPRRQSSSYRDRIADDHKIVEERKRYEEALRRKDDERRQRERELKLENERFRERLEKERLAKENLELKLKLAQVNSSATTAPSRNRRPSPSPSSHSLSRRPISPVRRHESTNAHRSPDRRPQQTSSSSYGRHGGHVSPRRNHRSRSPRARSPPRYEGSRRSPPPPARAPVNDRNRDHKGSSYRGGAPGSAPQRFDSRGERERERAVASDRYGNSREERSRRNGRDFSGNSNNFERSAGSSGTSGYPSRRSGNDYDRGGNGPVSGGFDAYNGDYRSSGGNNVAPYSTSSRNTSGSVVPGGSWPSAPSQYTGNGAPSATWSQAPAMPSLATSWNQFGPNVRSSGNGRGYGQF